MNGNLRSFVSVAGRIINYISLLMVAGHELCFLYRELQGTIGYCSTGFCICCTASKGIACEYWDWDGTNRRANGMALVIQKFSISTLEVAKSLKFYDF